MRVRRRLSTPRDVIGTLGIAVVGGGLGGSDIFGIDDMEAALDQSIEDRPSNAFVCEEGRHTHLTRLR